MSRKKNEIKKRVKIALDAVKAAHGTRGDELGATRFVAHHLEELPGDYWEEHCKTATPTPSQVLDILELRSEFDDDDDDFSNFDFTLPGDVTDYVLCVTINDDGEVEDISMES